MNYPIIKTDQHQLFTKKNKKSYFYKLILPDLEQKDTESLEIFLLNFVKTLNRVDPSAFFKFYHLNGETYLNTSMEDVHFFECDIVPELNHFELFWEKRDLYSDISIRDDYINVNGEYWRFLNLYQMPENITPCYLVSGEDFVINFSKIDDSKAIRDLDQKRKSHKANSIGFHRNLDSEGSYFESEDMLKKIKEGEEALFNVEVWYILKALTLEDLHHKTYNFIKNVEKNNLEILLETVAQSHVIKHMIPGMEPLYKRTHLVHTSYLSKLLPLTDDHLMNSGMTFYSKSQKDIKLNLFDRSSSNANMLVSGETGKGKSFFVAKMVKELLVDTRVIVLDLGNSFKRLAEYCEASIFSDSLNPMQFKDPSFLKEFITSFIPEGESLGAKEEGRLYSKIKNLLENGTESFRDLIDCLEKDFEGINYYFSDSWSYLKSDEVIVDNFTYIDTSLFPDKLKTPIILYLVELFKSLDGQKLFVIDECWDFLNRHAEYVDKFFRTYRKKGGGVIAISQSMTSDFLSTDLGRSISNNSYYKVFFKQEAYDDSYFSSFDIDKIKNLRTVKGDYSESYFKTEDLRKVIRYYPSKLEYELFTTEPKEVETIEEFSQKYSFLGNYKDRVDRLVEIKYG